MAPRSSRWNRFAWAAITLGLLVALGFDVAEWSGKGAINWPAEIGRVAMLVLAGTNLLDPRSSRLRQILTSLSAVLIFVALFFQVRRHL